jgi:hypothetical protein
MRHQTSSAILPKRLYRDLINFCDSAIKKWRDVTGLKEMA